MTRLLAFIALVLPLGCLAQFTIKGRVLNKADKKPIENVSVFLSNATIGDKTAADGSFTLRNVKPGKYDLVVTDIAFTMYSQPVVVENNVSLPDIVLAPQVRSLDAVTIKYHADPYRSRYLGWFTDAFIGMSDRARDCKIVNPEVLDLRYNEDTQVLTASSSDFIVIENKALGYKVKYLLTDFWLRDSLSHQQLRYKGYSLFEELKGTAGQHARWQRTRDEVYANSPMHFFRAAIADKLDENNFKVQKLADVPNPRRPPDSLIEARLAYFKSAEHHNRDSLAFWNWAQKQPRTFRKLLPDTIRKRNIITRVAGRNLYALFCNNCDLIVAYNPNHHFHIDDQIQYFYNRGNTDNTFVKFNKTQVPVYAMGVLSDPFDLAYQGVWGRNRMAELLPVDYEPFLSMENSEGQDLILAKLDSFAAVHPAEKAYLQFDKPYYAAGDTLYFKAYVTMDERHMPSHISGVLYVDLINTKNKIDRSLKLQLTDGVGRGDFALPDSLPKGNYRVRAWTQWMRNDPGSFFEKTIPIGSTQSGKVPESNTMKTPPGKPDVQFFPEAGALIAGIKSRIAFKAIGPNGLGIHVKGEIQDNDNKTISSFASTHLGMGSFELVPEQGKTYHAKISFPGGTMQTIDLPKAEEKGIAISVNNDSIPVAKVRIMANDAYLKENKGKSYTLVIYSGGVANTTSFPLDSLNTTMQLIKRKLFTGVTTITLFSPNNEPLAERLIFVQNYDQLSLNIATDKAQYMPRENVTLKLNAKTRADSATMGRFSIAVTDESKVPDDENGETTILTNLLLTSDLKGYVEQPNYYFNHITDATTKNLDLVMLTHGYRRFQWQDILSNPVPVVYQPEHDLAITGTVKNVFGKPVVKGTISLITYMGGPVLSQTTDEKGNFKFSGLNFTDTSKFVLAAINDKGKNSTFISYNKQLDEPPVIPQAVTVIDTNRSMLSYLQNHKEQWDQYAKYGLPGGRLLNEIKIKAFKRKDDDYRSSNLIGPGHADQVMHADEIAQIQGPLPTSLNGRLRGVKFMLRRVGFGYDAFLTMPNTSGPMLVVVDGVQPADINTLTANNVETVEVLRFLGSTAIYGMDGANGVLIITTKQGKGLDPKEMASKGVLPVNMPGYYRARQFYAPKYEHPTDNPNRKDLRSTIYWQPDLDTDKDGNASITFSNADGKGNYRVVVEGMDGKGNIGRVVYRYEVR